MNYIYLCSVTIPIFISTFIYYFKKEIGQGQRPCTLGQRSQRKEARRSHLSAYVFQSPVRDDQFLERLQPVYRRSPALHVDLQQSRVLYLHPIRTFPETKETHISPIYIIPCILKHLFI